MKNNLFWAVGLIVLGVCSAAMGVELEEPAKEVLRFGTMTAVSGPYVGAENPIRGLSGGGVPWAVSEARGELRENGKLRVQVRGLVLAAGPLAGTNPAATFRAVVSCQSIDPTGNPAVVNITSADFPATPAGNGQIEATLAGVPNPCFAPIIFVTSTTGHWFAVTGF